MNRGARVWLWPLIGVAIVLALVLFVLSQTLVVSADNGGGQGPVTTVVP